MSTRACDEGKIVMAGFNPAIHVLFFPSDEVVDARDKPGHDDDKDAFLED